MWAGQPGRHMCGAGSPSSSPGSYLLGRLEPQADVLVVSRELLFAGLSQQDPLLVLEDGGLLLVGSLRLRGRGGG